jgi:GTP-binding protein Era
MIKKKIIKIALVGKTNAGKSTLINSLVGEKISIINKKINTTQESILGIRNINTTQIIFYDTPGSNFLKTTNLTQKKLKIHLWQSIDSVDFLIYLIDVIKYNFKEIEKEILKISEVGKPIILTFNKIDLIDNKKILPMIVELKKIDKIKDFFLISAKRKNGIDDFLSYLESKSYSHEWIYNNDEVTDKDDIYISNECTRNAILEYIHQEIPYNIKIINNSFKFLKNNDLKIKQSIELFNSRYKAIILGKKGTIIKKIREKSQIDIKNIFNCNVHLYLKVIIHDEK